MVRGDRVTFIKAAIVFVAGVGTAVIVFVTSVLAFDLDLVIRGRRFDMLFSWLTLIWMVLPNLILLWFVRGWWRQQDDRLALESGHPKMVPWLLGYLAVTAVALTYYLLTFTEALAP